MLADAFNDFVQAREARMAERQQARNERDQFIAAQFPALDTLFSTMIDEAVGAHALLQVDKQSVVQTFTDRGFSSLTMTVITVTSTLNASAESVAFTPALASIDPGQFARIAVDAGDLPARRRPHRAQALHDSMLKRGVLMLGTTASRLVVARGVNYQPLDTTLLEGLLRVLLLRGGGA